MKPAVPDWLVEIVYYACIVATWLAVSLALMFFFTPRAHAAVWMSARYRVAGTRKPIAIIGRRWVAPRGPWVTTFVWDAPDAAKGIIIPTAAGVYDTAWFSVSEDPALYRLGGTAVRLAAVWGVGDTSRWSNLKLLVAGLPDSLVFDAAGTRWAEGACAGWRQPVPNARKPAVREASWVRAVGDTELVLPPTYGGLGPRGPVIGYQDLVVGLRWTAGMCPVYGQWCLAGSRLCP